MRRVLRGRFPRLPFLRRCPIADRQVPAVSRLKDRAPRSVRRKGRPFRRNYSAKKSSGGRFPPATVPYRGYFLPSLRAVVPVSRCLPKARFFSPKVRVPWLPIRFPDARFSLSVRYNRFFAKKGRKSAPKATNAAVQVPPADFSANFFLR